MSDANGAWAVEFLGVSKRYKHFNLDDLNFRLPQGEILGLVGPNGAGKSTCLRLLMGFVQPDSGKICVLNKAIPKHVHHHRACCFMGSDSRFSAKRFFLKPPI